MNPFVALGAPELLIILAVLILLFGAAKLPELARGSGRALRIFKAETKGLKDDDAAEDDAPEVRARELGAGSTAQDPEVHSSEPHPRGDTTT